MREEADQKLGVSGPVDKVEEPRLSEHLFVLASET